MEIDVSGGDIFFSSSSTARKISQFGETGDYPNTDANWVWNERDEAVANDRKALSSTPLGSGGIDAPGIIYLEAGQTFGTNETVTFHNARIFTESDFPNTNMEELARTIATKIGNGEPIA